MESETRHVLNSVKIFVGNGSRMNICATPVNRFVLDSLDRPWVLNVIDWGEVTDSKQTSSTGRCVVIAGDRTFTRIGSLVVILGWCYDLDALRTAMFL